MKLDMARFLSVFAVCLAATLASSNSQELGIGQDRHLLGDIAAATAAAEATPNPPIPDFLAAAAASTPFDPLYPDILTQQMEEKQAYAELVKSTGGRPVLRPNALTARKIRDAEQRVARWKAAEAQRVGISAAAVTAAAFSVRVETYWFIYHLDNGTGIIENNIIDEQMRRLNSAYGNTGFSFVTRGIKLKNTSLPSRPWLQAP